MTLDLRYYLSAFLRRLPLFLLVAVSIGAAGVAVATLLPTTYTARAVLLVESPQIPSSLASSTVRVGAREQIELVRRRLVTRANLIEIARDHDVYEDIRTMTPDQIENAMRRDVRMRDIARNATVLLEVEFTARTPDLSARVANEFVTRAMADNARQRMRVAEDTLAFFEQEVARLEAALEERSAAILRFQAANADALPGNRDFRENRRTMLQERLATLQRDRAALADRRRRLVDVFETTGRIQPASAGPRSFEERQLEAARRDLSSALAVYSETSPKVQILQTRVEQLEAEVAAAAADAAGAEIAGVDGDRALFDLQLEEIESRLDFVDEEAARIEAEIAELDDSLARTPANALRLEALQRDYANVQRQHSAAVERLAAAQTGERIEVLSKGQRISVIEQAVAPTSPASPDRPMIAAGGVGAGLAAGLGLVALLELLDRSVRRPLDLTRGLGITPLVTVPYISTRGERLRRRLVAIALVLLAALGIPAALWYVHYQILPLDLLADRVLARLGL
jgi:uncharacterized protein involved in exopolysaccharide biosynthesis